MSQQYRSAVYLSDVSGTGYWRRMQQILNLNCLSQSTDINVFYSQQPVLERGFYKGMNSVTIQRWISDQQMAIFNQILKPSLENNGGWIIYEIDDNMSDKAIPLFNRGRKAFEGEKVQGNIKKMLNESDFVTTTTDYLKERYHELYGVPLENIISVPNLLPKFWFGDRYNPEKKIEQFKKFRNKPRIGIVSSLSHFNVDNVRISKDGKACRSRTGESVAMCEDGRKATWNPKNEKWFLEDGSEVDMPSPIVWEDEDKNIVKFEDTEKITDDFDEISECVRSTVDDFQWVFVGYCPPQVKDLVEKRKIEYHGGTTILNYPSHLDNLQFQAIVAPIKKMEFNYSKSFIKTMECAALGIPLFATNCLPYSRVMKREQLFDTGDELKEKLIKFKFSSNGVYNSMISQQWKWLNSPTREGDFNIKNFWLDDNLQIWVDLARLKQKCRGVSMKFVHDQVVERKRKEEESRLMKNEETGVEIIK